MSPVTITDLADIVIYKVLDRCSLLDRLLALELVNSRWRRLSFQATSAPDCNAFETISTREFQKASLAFHFVFQNYCDTNGLQRGPPPREVNVFLLRLLQHVLPRIGNNLKAVKLLPKQERNLDLEDQESTVSDDIDEVAPSGFPISKSAVDLLVRYCPNLMEIDFGQTYCNEGTAQLLTRFRNLESLIFRVAGENSELYLTDLLPSLKLKTLGSAQGPIACADTSQLRSLRLYNGWHREFETIKSKIHVRFPNLEQIVRAQSRVYSGGDSSDSDDSDSDEDDRQYLASVCKLKQLRRFDDMTSVIKSEADLDQLLKSSPNFTSLRLTSTFEGDFNTVLKANWIHRIRAMCLCDLKVNLSCLRAIFAVGTMVTLRLNCFVQKDVEDAAAVASACANGKNTTLIGECLASLRRFFVSVRLTQTHEWANELTRELLWSDRVCLRRFDGGFICEKDTLASFGEYALAGKSRHMTHLRLKTDSDTLLPMFDENKEWPSLLSLDITCRASSSSSRFASSLDFFKPLLSSDMRRLTRLATKLHCTPAPLCDLVSRSMTENGGFSTFLVASCWPRLKTWYTMDVKQESKAYELLRQLAAHPSLQQASVNGLFPRWNLISVSKAVRNGREILATRNGRRMHALRITLLCNGERVFDENGVSHSATAISNRIGLVNAAAHIGSCWELVDVHIN